MTTLNHEAMGDYDVHPNVLHNEDFPPEFDENIWSAIVNLQGLHDKGGEDEAFTAWDAQVELGEVIDMLQVAYKCVHQYGKGL